MNKNFMYAIVCTVFLSLHSSSAPHEFYGRHFVASYKNCDENSLRDTKTLLAAFEQAVLSTGATILKSDVEYFEGGGLTAFMVLSESHASIHTYPEYNACFVDLFTCGTHCTHEKFDALLTEYFQAKLVTKNLCIRE